MHCSVPASHSGSTVVESVTVTAVVSVVVVSLSDSVPVGSGPIVVMSVVLVVFVVGVPVVVVVASEVAFVPSSSSPQAATSPRIEPTANTRGVEVRLYR